MKTLKCLYCYQPLENGEVDFHPRCARKFFGPQSVPDMPYSLDDLYELANQVIRKGVSVTGVQAKLPIDLPFHKNARKRSRFSVDGLLGKYILKPPVEEQEYLPENEDLTMHLAGIFGLRIVPHSLVRLKSGELAYLTRRIDRSDGKKFPMEDMCQLTGRLTEEKYKGSMEEIGKVISKFSDNSGFDKTELFSVAIFSFLCGNADMHLKNFSLLRGEDGLTSLAPAYDLVSTKLVLPKDDEETALTINGKKTRLGKDDFYELGMSLGVSETVGGNIYANFYSKFREAYSFVQQSFLSDRLIDSYQKLLLARARRIWESLPVPNAKGSRSG